MGSISVGRIESLFFLERVEGTECQLQSVLLSIFDCVIFGLDFPVPLLNRSNGGC
jgi:hypothetical protein